MSIDDNIILKIKQQLTKHQVRAFEAEITLKDLIKSFCSIAMKQLDSLYLCEEEPIVTIEDKSHRKQVTVFMNYNKLHDIEGLFDDITMLLEDWLEEYIDNKNFKDCSSKLTADYNPLDEEGNIIEHPHEEGENGVL